MERKNSLRRRIAATLAIAALATAGPTIAFAVTAPVAAACNGGGTGGCVG
jgi:hypothetical protein